MVQGVQGGGGGLGCARDDEGCSSSIWEGGGGGVGEAVQQHGGTGSCTEVGCPNRIAIGQRVAKPVKVHVSGRCLWSCEASGNGARKECQRKVLLP